MAVAAAWRIMRVSCVNPTNESSGVVEACFSHYPFAFPLLYILLDDLMQTDWLLTNGTRFFADFV